MYEVNDSHAVRTAIRKISARWEVKQFLQDVKEYLDERACDFKTDMDTRDANDALITLLEYLKRQMTGHLEVIELLREENIDNWR